MLVEMLWKWETCDIEIETIDKSKVHRYQNAIASLIRFFFSASSSRYRASQLSLPNRIEITQSQCDFKCWQFHWDCSLFTIKTRQDKQPNIDCNVQLVQLWFEIYICKGTFFYQYINQNALRNFHQIEPLFGVIILHGNWKSIALDFQHIHHTDIYNMRNRQTDTKPKIVKCRPSRDKSRWIWSMCCNKTLNKILGLAVKQTPFNAAIRWVSHSIFVAHLSHILYWTKWFGIVCRRYKNQNENKNKKKSQQQKESFLANLCIYMFMYNGYL